MNHDAIAALAAYLLDRGWSWEVVGPVARDETDVIVRPVLAEALASLSAPDRTRFAGYVPVVERPGDTPDQALARAKLGCLLSAAIQTEQFARAIAVPLADAPVFSRFPDLQKHLDDDDMLPAKLFQPLPDAFQYRGHAVAFSDFTPFFLRRKLTKLAAQPGTNLRWRPANDEPVPIGNYVQRLEEAVEFGISFRDGFVLKRLWKKRLPTVLRREAPISEAEAAYDGLNPIERLEVLRTERSGRVSLLFEELVPLSERHIEIGFVTTRIFHCDSVMGTGTFEHVDASQLIYRVETYETRLASGMKDKVKAQGHLKLFWVASCPIAEWKALLAATYPRNELVPEYLTGIRSCRPMSRRARVIQ